MRKNESHYYACVTDSGELKMQNHGAFINKGNLNHQPYTREHLMSLQLRLPLLDLTTFKELGTAKP